MTWASVPGQIGTVLIDSSETLAEWDRLLDRVEDGVTFMLRVTGGLLSESFSLRLKATGRR